MRYVAIVFMLVFCVVVTGLLGPLLLAGGAQFYQQLRAPHYAAVQGEVLESAYEDGFWSVRYAYQVDGHRYNSTLIRGGLMQGGANEPNERALALAHPIGSAITVHYDARDPRTAVLDTRLIGWDLIALVLMLMPMGFIAGPWGALISLVLWDRRPMERGACKLTTGPTGAMHLRMPAMSPWTLISMLALLAPIPIFFLTLIGTLIVSGGNLSVWIGVLVVIAAYAIVFGIPFWVWLKRQRGEHDLIIDSANVSAPAMHGRKVREFYKRSEIVGLDVYEVRGRRGRVDYLVSVVLAKGAGPMIASYPNDGERAEALAHWLGQTLSKPVKLAYGLD